MGMKEMLVGHWDKVKTPQLVTWTSGSESEDQGPWRFHSKHK